MGWRDRYLNTFGDSEKSLSVGVLLDALVEVVRHLPHLRDSFLEGNVVSLL